MMTANNTHIQKAGTNNAGKGRPLKATEDWDTMTQPSNGVNRTIKGFKPKAADMLPCSIWCEARRDPQPGQ